MTAQQPAERTFPELSRRQLEIYAEEFRQSFENERRLTASLEARNAELEQRTRELTALNEMFQSQINASVGIVDEFRGIGDVLSALSRSVIEAADVHEVPPILVSEGAKSKSQGVRPVAS